jgi:flavin reductase (DIM6/NTAB) family NADH-FMN oxidoreductase RutF
MTDGQLDAGVGLRAAMRLTAASVAVITSRLEDLWVGATSTSVVSVSISPASVLVCLNRQAQTRAGIVSTGRFNVNLLHARQSDQARIFGSPEYQSERFRCGHWESDAHGLPALASAQALLHCSLAEMHEVGTHTVLVGAVEHTMSSGEYAPLLYGNGGYFTLLPKVSCQPA